MNRDRKVGEIEDELIDIVKQLVNEVGEVAAEEMREACIRAAENY